MAIKYSCYICIIILLILNLCIYCNGHGRLIEPPSRASAWRYGFQTPPDYNDHELYCGGFTRQWKRNDGKCGECGDAWDSAQPRAHEFGGQWGQGVIVRRYMPGADMTIRVELTASHMGYFEFRLCPEPDGKQECLDKHLLKLLGGSPAVPAPNDLETRFYPRNGSRIYEIKAQLPDLLCEHCLLQWRYIAGNNWGMCPDGNGAVGCGPQEEFRACSDIALVEDAHTPIRPFRPTTLRTPTTKTKTSTESTTTTQQDEQTQSFNVILFICILFILLLFSLTLWYLYRRHENQIKEWWHSMGSRFCKKYVNNTNNNSATTRIPVTSMVAVTSVPYTTSSKIAETLDNPPVPPPRTKKQSRVKEMTPDQSSVA